MCELDLVLVWLSHLSRLWPGALTHLIHIGCIRPVAYTCPITHWHCVCVLLAAAAEVLAQQSTRPPSAAAAVDLAGVDDEFATFG